MLHCVQFIRQVAIALSGLALCGAAMAQQRLLPAQSEIAFVSKQMGVPVEGYFKRFDAQINFDPAKLASSKIVLSVDTASATLGAKETDAELQKPGWFDTAKFAKATFQSSAIKSLGAGKFEVQGKLTIKGISTDVTVPLSLTQNGATTLASGQVLIKRLVFKIGDAEWSDTSVVADEVLVKFKLALSGMAPL